MIRTNVICVLQLQLPFNSGIKPIALLGRVRDTCPGTPGAKLELAVILVGELKTNIFISKGCIHPTIGGILKMWYLVSFYSIKIGFCTKCLPCI